MAEPGDLTTLENALLALGQTSDENGVIAGLITAVSTQIQKFLSYQVASQPYTRTFNGRGGRALMLPDRPVTAVASVTIDDLAVPPSTSVHSPGFVFDDKSIYLRGCYEFCRGAQNVAVNYTAGYAEVPADIERACLSWLQIFWDNLDTIPGVQEIAAGDSSITYGEAIAQIGNSTILMPPIIASALQPYQKVAPV